MSLWRERKLPSPPMIFIYKIIKGKWKIHNEFYDSVEPERLNG